MTGKRLQEYRDVSHACGLDELLAFVDELLPVGAEERIG